MEFTMDFSFNKHNDEINKKAENLYKEKEVAITKANLFIDTLFSIVQNPDFVIDCDLEKWEELIDDYEGYFDSLISEISNLSLDIIDRNIESNNW